MVADSAPYLQVYWYLGFFPTLAIALIMLSFTFVGDGLRDALDPRQT
jgi:ABC-type dipeptide/oligopeptide/nickel transport system permease subunit